MTKIFKNVFLSSIFFLLTPTSASNNNECLEILKKHDLNPYIKSKRGWVLFFNNPENVKKFEKQFGVSNTDILKCLLNYNFSNTFQIGDFNRNKVDKWKQIKQ